MGIFPNWPISKKLEGLIEEFIRTKLPDGWDFGDVACDMLDGTTVAQYDGEGTACCEHFEWGFEFARRVPENCQVFMAYGKRIDGTWDSGLYLMYGKDEDDMLERSKEVFDKFYRDEIIPNIEEAK